MSAVPDYIQETTEAGKIYSYCFPHDAHKNPHGNPHKISLPESVARRVPGESVDQYRARIATEVTFAMYPHMRRYAR